MKKSILTLAFFLLGLTACQTGYREVASLSKGPSLLPLGTKITLGDNVKISNAPSGQENISAWTAHDAIGGKITFCLITVQPNGSIQIKNLTKGRTYTLSDVQNSIFIDDNNEEAFTLKCSRNITTGFPKYEDETDLSRILAVLIDNNVKYVFPKKTN